MPAALETLATVHNHSIAQEVQIKAPPAAVFNALTSDIGFWWGPPHVVGEPIDIVLEPELGGRFMQVFAGGGGRMWCQVTGLEPNAYLELRGHMGMTAPVMGVISFTLEAHEGGTLLKLSHVFAGPVGDEAREGYNMGWTALLDGKLRSYVEEGKKVGVRK